MQGLRTAIILGAGASRCYTHGHGTMPLQRDMVGKLFMGLTATPGMYLGYFTEDGGIRYSERLATFLHQRFDIKEPEPEQSLLHFWTVLQERGYSLETLYNHLRDTCSADERWVTEEFEAILRSVVSGTVRRSLDGVCQYHTALAHGLEPGDYVISFNWDTIATDALYHHSRLWFPITGFGLRAGVLPNTPADVLTVESLVVTLHVHGCVALYLLVDAAGQEQQKLIYVAPESCNSASSRIEYLKVPEQPGVLRDAAPEEDRRFRSGWIRMPSGEWLCPLFVPPSTDKPHYRHWYHAALMRVLHTRLPSTERFVLAGYSIPPADIPYLRSMFVPEVISSDATLQVVNLSNDDSEFRARVDEMFPSISKKDYSISSFVEFCRPWVRQDT